MAAASVQSALELVEAVGEADLPLLRAGIAYGPALSRAGDWYGQSVNLSSRVTGVARPGSVLCTEEVRDAARISSRGRRRAGSGSRGVRVASSYIARGAPGAGRGRV